MDYGAAAADDVGSVEDVHDLVGVGAVVLWRAASVVGVQGLYWSCGSEEGEDAVEQGGEKEHFW